MKNKSIILALFAAVVTLFTSCEGPMGPMGPEGPQGPQGPQGEGMNWEVLSVTIPSKAWKLMDGGYLTASAEVKQLTKFICEEGMVHGYVVFSDGVQTLLPSETYCAAEVFNKETGLNDIVYYQRQIDFEFSPGSVNFYYTITDFYYDDDWPDDMTFRLVLQW